MDEKQRFSWYLLYPHNFSLKCKMLVKNGIFIQHHNSSKCKMFKHSNILDEIIIIRIVNLLLKYKYIYTKYN